MSARLEGRTILVTGAASGIGAAYARVTARHGATVVLMDVDEDGLEKVRGELVDAGAAAVRTEQVDISDGDQVDEVFRRVGAELPVDGAFLNAGINGTKSIRLPEGEVDQVDRELWHRVLDVNLNGFFYTLQRSVELLKRAGHGTIVVTGSTSGVRAEPLIGYPYVASKTAVHAVVRQAALELAKRGIRINAIAPGSFRTNIAGPLPPPPEKTAIWNDGIPLRRHGQPEELEELALLLIDEKSSSFMTGGIYVADGGASVLTQVTSDLL